MITAIWAESPWTICFSTATCHDECFHGQMIKIIRACQHFKEASHLTVPTYDHLFASKHDICGSFQAGEV